MAKSCAFSWRRNGPELDQQPEGVDLRPVFYQLAVHDAVHGDSFHLHVFSRRRNAQKLTGMLAVAGDPGDDPVAIGVLVVDLVVEVGERLERIGKGLPGALDAG